MSEYSAIFDVRGRHYNLANHRFPAARREEALAILRHLALPGDFRRPWLDLAAGGGYLAERAREEGVGAPAVACDASMGFLSESTAYRARVVSRYESLPFADGSFAAAACLAAFHHADDPPRVVAEMLRVTAAGGRAAVGDVAPGSPMADFLNDFVHRHTDTGHLGRFSSAAELAGAFHSAGGKAILTETLDLDWHFRDGESAIEFSRELFGLRRETSAAEIRDRLDRLGLNERDGELFLPWRMVFVSAER